MSCCFFFFTRTLVTFPLGKVNVYLNYIFNFTNAFPQSHINALKKNSRIQFYCFLCKDTGLIFVTR